MMSIHKILTIAVYEMRTLLRSWFFRIFTGLSIVGIGIFNIVANLVISNVPFIYRALPASLPYANLLILNIGQAIVAVFLASEFLKQDKKNDTVEVIYARSMTNSEYIIGKSIGILLVFLVLNFIILSIGIASTLISGDASQSILEYLYYPLIISIPTLIYILGFSFFLMIITKNQAITFIILLGYIGLSVFYLKDRYYQIFDFIAYQIPMMNSTVGGFGDFKEILIHRGIYFLFGIAAISFTISKLDRLPQSVKFKNLPMVISIVFLGLGLYTAYKYIDDKRGIIEYKNKLIGLNNKYCNYSTVDVDSCKINLTHNGNSISAKTKLVIQNRNSSTIDTLIFSLNPSLTITNLKLNNRKIDFTRELQLLIIPLADGIKPNQTNSLIIDYSGTINESTCFLDQDLINYKDNTSLELFRVKKRYSYLTDKFVLLTREALWYPVSGVGYSTLSPAYYVPDFTNFSLSVSTDPNLVAISQGGVTSSKSGEFNFLTDKALPQISLLIGNYNSYSVKVDSINYSLFTIAGNNYFEQYFTDIGDSLPGIIRELKNEYESQLGFEYPFKYFSLAEVPIQFSLSKHIWSLTSDAVQPEIIFYPEKGVLFEETDFKKRVDRAEKKMKKNKEEITDVELQTRIFKQFVRKNFDATNIDFFTFRGVDKNTYSIFPNYVSFTTALKSREWPALNLSLEAYLKDRNSNLIKSFRWFFTDLSKSEEINLKLKNKSLSELTLSPPRPSDKRDEVTLSKLIIQKGDYLFSIFRSRYGKKEFNALIDSIVLSNQQKTFSIAELDSAMINRFNESILDRINDWYYGNNLPGFLIADVETYKIIDDENTKYQIRFKISNPEDVDGLVTVNIDLFNPNNQVEDEKDGEPDFSKDIYIAANTAKEVGFVFTSEPQRMNIFTHISLNLPNNLIYDFGAFGTTKKVPAFDTVIDCKLFTNLLVKGEIVVDNEDSSFHYYHKSNKSYLKSLIDKNKDPGHGFSKIRYRHIPTEWKKVLRSEFYGKYIRSAYYTRSDYEGRTATWTADVSDSAFFDVYCHIQKIKTGMRNSKKADYNFTVFYDGGIEKVNLPDSEIENGWNYIGTYYFTPGNATVELSNKSVGRMVFADAVKWVIVD